MSAGGGLAGHPIALFAEGGDDEVGFAGGGDSVGDGLGFVGDGRGGGGGSGTFDEAGASEDIRVVAGEDIDTAGDEEVGAEPLGEGGFETNGVSRIAGGFPGAEHVFGGVGEGADECDGFCPLAEGEQGAVAFGAVVFEEDDGLLGDLAGEGALFRSGDVWGVGGGVRVLEEAEGELDAEDAAGGFVDDGLGDEAGADLIGEGGAVEVAFHIHIDAGGEGLAGGGGAVGGDGVVEKLGDGAPVGDDEAVKAPLVAQDIGEGVVVGGGGDAVDGVEAGHESGGTGIDGGFVGWQPGLAELVVAHVGGVVVAAGDGGTVGGVVLDADGDGVGLGEIVLLVAADPGLGDGGTEEGIFAGGLNDASPAGVAGDIDHGGEDPLYAIGAGLNRGSAGDGGDEGGVPTGGEGDGDGEDGALAVDDVVAEDEGDVKAGFFDGDFLEGVGFFGVGEVEKGADLAAAGEVLVADFGAVGTGGVSGGVLGELADFFLEGHLPEEGFDAAVEVGAGELGVGVRLGLGGSRERGKGKDCSGESAEKWRKKAVVHGKGMVHGSWDVGRRRN